MNSLDVDAQWIARQGRAQMAVSLILPAANMAITQALGDAYWYRQAVQDTVSAIGSQSRRGRSRRFA